MSTVWLCDNELTLDATQQTLVDISKDIPKDPRIRRTRRLLQQSLTELLARSPFSDLSITDICKHADIARVTFYQHYDSKEALLLASVTEFFGGLHQTITQEKLDLYFETGNVTAFDSIQEVNLAKPDQIRLIGIALQYVGASVRKLMLASFLETYSQRETELEEKEVQILATFYVGGMLTLLEQFLNGELSISQSEVQIATLKLLRILRQGMIESDIL